MSQNSPFFLDKSGNPEIGIFALLVRKERVCEILFFSFSLKRAALWRHTATKKTDKISSWSQECLFLDDDTSIIIITIENIYYF